MAKEKGARKATKASRKKSALRPVAARSSDRRPVHNQELRNGLVGTQTLVETLRDELRQQQEEARRENQQFQEEVRRELQQINERMAHAEESLAQIGSGQPAAGDMEQVGEGTAVQGWREQIWIDEYDPKEMHRLPRATMLGRALVAIGATPDARDTPNIVNILEILEREGRHHLPESVVQDLATYREKIPDDSKSRSKASSRLTKLFNPRYEWLCRKAIAERGGARRVSKRGRQVFDGWPDWSVQDDAPSECYGRVLPPQDPTV